MVRVAMVLAGFLTLTAVTVEPPRRQRGSGHVPPLIPRRELFQIFGAGYRHMLADYFWIQTIQATGKATNRHQYRDIYAYADLATDLDPYFRQVYTFAATAVTYNLGRDTWVNTEESTRLLEKGLRYFPHDIYLRIILAFNLSYYHHRPRDAARLLEETARIPGAPRYLSALATRLYAQAGEFDAGLALAEELARSDKDPATREAFQRRVLEIRLERILQQLDAGLATFRQREGREPESLADLVDAGIIDSIPDDPLGGTLVIGSDGRARSTQAEDRLEAHGGVSNLEANPGGAP